MDKKKGSAGGGGGVEDLISISEAARLRGVTPQAIDDLLKRGKLEAEVVAGRRLLRRSAVLAFVPGGGSKSGRKALSRWENEGGATPKGKKKGERK